MKAAEFYQCFDAQTSPTLSTLGFERQRGRVSRWFQRLESGQLHVVFRTNPKYPWEPYSGGDFFTEAYFGVDHRSRWADIEACPSSALDFFGYWPDADYLELSQIGEHVRRKVAALEHEDLLEKLRPIGATLEIVRSFHETALDCMEMDLESVADRATLNPSQYYYDADDVVLWGALTSRMLPVVLAGVRDSPKLPFAR